MQFSHITLTVKDKDVSAEWYQHLLGKATVTPREERVGVDGGCNGPLVSLSD